MTHRACILAALMVVTGCTLEVGESAGASTEITTESCSLSGFGMLENGEFFGGRVTGDGTTVTGTWAHVATTGEVILADPDRISCRINGREVADVWGTATVDGDPSYTFRIFAEDRGEPGPPDIVEGPPEVRTLTATRTYRPSRWTDGRIDERVRVTVPASLPVTVGNAGNQWAWLSFQRSDTFDVVTCRYRGGASTPVPRTPAELAAGEAYHLERCTGEWYGTPPVDAGSVEDVRWIALRVQTGAHMLPSRHAAETTVSVDLDIVPLIERPRPRDFYLIEVRDAAGAITFFSDGDVARGDLRVRETL